MRRPEQLDLQDDPGFTPEMIIPDLELDLDDSNIESSHRTSSRGTSVLSSKRSRKSSHTSDEFDESVLGLRIPSSQGTRNSGVRGGFDLPMSDPILPPSDHGLVPQGTDDAFYPDLDFNFNEEGGLVDTDALRGSISRDAVAGPPKRRRSASAGRRESEAASKTLQGDVSTLFR